MPFKLDTVAYECPECEFLTDGDYPGGPTDPQLCHGNVVARCYDCGGTYPVDDWIVVLISKREDE